MASSSGPLNEELQCSICLDVFTDPVTTPCGHNFCRTCLDQFWTKTKSCCCPTCKETFSRRPDLKINTTRRTVIGEKVRMIQRTLFREEIPRTQSLPRGTNQRPLPLPQTQSLPKGTNPLLQTQSLPKGTSPLQRTQSLQRGTNENTLPLYRMQSLPRGTNQCPLPLPQTQSVLKGTGPLPQTQSLPKGTNLLPRTQSLQRGTNENTLSLYRMQSLPKEISPLPRTQSLPTGTNQQLFPQHDICDERKLKALKSCPTCQRCSDDQMSVCLSYTDVDHRTHNTVPIEEESQQKKLVKTKIDVQQMILDRMRKIQEIQHSVELKKRNTEKKKSASVELFTDLIHSFERCQYDLLKMIEEQQKAAEKQAEDLIKELQQEITDLKRRNTELEQLSHTDKQIFSSLYSRPQRNWTEISINSDVNVLPMNKALTLVKKTYETLNKELSQNVLKCVQKFAVDVTLDPDTANPYLILSDDGKQVSYGDIKPGNPERFDVGLCVLAKKGFSSGRFYFEVQVKGKTQWSLGVARKCINRKEEITLTPEDGYWTVIVKNENQYMIFDNPVVMFPQWKPNIVGVFVDYEEGLVSFYDVGHRSHIYSFTGQTFTEKLYPYFSPGLYDEGKNSNPLIISPVNKKRINPYRIRKYKF